MTAAAGGRVLGSAGQDIVLLLQLILVAQRERPHCSRHTCRTGGGTADLMGGRGEESWVIMDNDKFRVVVEFEKWDNREDVLSI